MTTDIAYVRYKSMCPRCGRGLEYARYGRKASK